MVFWPMLIFGIHAHEITICYYQTGRGRITESWFCSVKKPSKHALKYTIKLKRKEITGLQINTFIRSVSTIFASGIKHCSIFVNQFAHGKFLYTYCLILWWKLSIINWMMCLLHWYGIRQTEKFLFCHRIRL